MAQNITLETLCSILTAALDQHPTKPLVLALDGRCGSGKTTLTNALVRQFPASAVLRTDDFYLPPAQRAHGWEQTPCANGVWESPHTVASKLESKEEFPQG